MPIKGNNKRPPVVKASPDQLGYLRQEALSFLACLNNPSITQNELAKACLDLEDVLHDVQTAIIKEILG